MKNYVLYSVSDTQKGSVPQLLVELCGFTFGLDEARRRKMLSLGRERPYYGPHGPVMQKAEFEVLRLPDDQRERDALMKLAEHGGLLTSPLRYSKKGYLLISELSGVEQGVNYAAGWFRTQAEAKECQTKGRLVQVLYKGSNISLSGDVPSEPRPDLWNSPD